MVQDGLCMALQLFALPSRRRRRPARSELYSQSSLRYCGGGELLLYTKNRPTPETKHDTRESGQGFGDTRGWSSEATIVNSYIGYFHRFSSSTQSYVTGTLQPQTANVPDTQDSETFENHLGSNFGHRHLNVATGKAADVLVLLLLGVWSGTADSCSAVVATGMSMSLGDVLGVSEPV